MLGIGIDYAIQMHARVEEEVVIDRADHPIQETARNLGPALLVVTFDAIFAFAALRFAKVPMLRQFGLLLAVGVAAICVNSIVGAARDPRHPRVQVADEDARTSARVRSAGSSCGSAASRRSSRSASPIASIVIFVGGIIVEDKLVLQTDPIQWVNQDSQVIKDLDVIDEETGSSSELGVFVQAERRLRRRDRRVHRRVHPRAAREEPGDAAHRYEHRRGRQRPQRRPRRDRTSTPTGEQVQAAYDVAPKDIQLSTANPEAGALNLVFRTGPSGLDERAVVVREIRKTTDAARGHPRHAVGARGRRRRPARQPRGQPDPAHLPRDPVRVPVPRDPAAQHRPGAAVARPGAHRRRRRVAVRLRARPEAEPDDRGRRTARGRGVHRVHVADPAALRRGTTPRPVATRRGRRDRVAHRPGVHRLGADRDRRRRGHRDLVAAAPAGLRHHRGAQRRGRAAERARRAAAAAGLGRREEAPLGLPRPRPQGDPGTHRHGRGPAPRSR